MNVPVRAKDSIAKAGSHSGRDRAWNRRVVSPAVGLLSTLISVSMAEAVLRTMFDPLRVLDGDARWEYRWRQTRSAARFDADMEGQYRFDVYDPVLGWKPRAGYSVGGVRTNALGIRADREFTFDSPPDISRVVIVGDSFMWGEGVANEETFASRLEDLLSDTEVINLGVHGYGTDQQLLRLRDPGLRFEPDLVILGFYEENMWRNALAFRDYAKPRYRWSNGDLVLERQPVPSPEVILAKDQQLPRSFLLVLAHRALRKARWNWAGRLEQSEEWRITEGLLNMVKQDVEAQGARLLLLYIPESDLAEAGRAEPLIEAWTTESETAFVNLREGFAELTDEDRLRLYDDHWTPFGNEVVAELVAAFIESRRLGLLRVSGQ